MTYSSVMVHLDLDEPNDARLHVAGDLAEQFDAKLIGIACCQPQPPVYANGGLAQSLVRELKAEANEKLNKLEQRFKTAYRTGSRTSNGAVPSPRLLISWRRKRAPPIW